MRLAIAALLFASVLAACGGSNDSGTSEATTPASATTAATSSTAVAPAELQATWRLVGDPIPTRLYLRETSYIVSLGGVSHHGTYSVDGDTIEFTSTCSDTNREGRGRYRWEVKGDTLHLDLLGKDECSWRSAVLEDATYERSG